jgi:hypothetical protein
MANSAMALGFVQAVEQVQEALGQQPLRRDVEQVELAGQQRALDRARTSSAVSVELRKAARTPSFRSAPTWSCISAISGETTMPVPGRSSAGIW